MEFETTEKTTKENGDRLLCQGDRGWWCRGGEVQIKLDPQELDWLEHAKIARGLIDYDKVSGIVII